MKWDYMRMLVWEARAWALFIGFMACAAAFWMGYRVRGSDCTAALALETAHAVLDQLDTLVVRQCATLSGSLLPGLCR